MTTRFILHGTMACALALGTAAAWADHTEINPNITEIKPGDSVQAARLPDNIYLRTEDDPDDIIWDRLPMYRTELFPAPPVHQSVKLRFDEGANRSKHLYFQVARSSERFYVRLQWKDDSQDTDTTVDSFRDGVAIQYAIGDTDTSYMMGSGPENPVNIWYWRADDTDRVENLAAGGYRSTTTLDEQHVTGAGAYYPDAIEQDSLWRVVMSRPLSADGEYDVDLAREQVPIAFAVWQGSDNERDGNKRVTHTWILLDTGLEGASDS
ncbi:MULTISPECIES: ethylbenzene dehydrogenase-related protein [unclassified Halomonas]|nr:MULTISPECIES: ethylbenzene dehydrogenase-related protein [unclassified Halomonas]MDT0511652.1 dimethylsulfide dehydrogenase [Halomonas sp. LES1]MDT0590060.1 dimethylsulfide dehydrogenase [Halomonas sp. PAR8]